LSGEHGKKEVQAVKLEEFAKEFLDTYVKANNKPSEMWWSAIAVALTTCLRLGELLALRWQDVDERGASLTVRQTDWRGQVGTPKAVQELLGHTNIRLTMRYSHLAPRATRTAVQVLDGLAYGNLTATQPDATVVKWSGR